MWILDHKRDTPRSGYQIESSLRRRTKRWGLPLSHPIPRDFLLPARFAGLPASCFLMFWQKLLGPPARSGQTGDGLPLLQGLPMQYSKTPVR